MIHTKSESDLTSSGPSSPSRSPKGVVYYVQSPSRDSHDGDKSSLHANSPLDSPSHPSSIGRHSRASSSSRFSGVFRSSSRKGNKKRNVKDWPECNVILEEGTYDDLADDKGLSRKCQAMLFIGGFIVLFTILCLIIWGASKPYKPDVVVKSMIVDDFYHGEGTDHTGVPTKMMTLNCSLKLSVYNPANMFGIHVSSTPINLFYSRIPVATGQIKRYYQPRKSRRTVSVNLEGTKVPLYGAAAGFNVPATGGSVPFTLNFSFKSQGDVVGKLVRTKHIKYVSCSVNIKTGSSNTITFKKDSCTYH